MRRLPCMTAAVATLVALSLGSSFMYLLQFLTYSPKDATATASYKLQSSSSSYRQQQQQLQQSVVVLEYNDTDIMEDFAKDFFDGKLCHRILQLDDDADVEITDALVAEWKRSMQQRKAVGGGAAAASAVVRIHQFSCEELYLFGNLGTGNYISALYGIRLAAQAIGNVHVHVHCFDAVDQRSDLILPWLTGWFPAAPPRELQQDAAAATPVSVQEACVPYDQISIGYYLEDMQYEFRTMALALVGDVAATELLASPLPPFNKQNTNNQYQLEKFSTPSSRKTPLFPKTELDEAVLHFRCGDLIGINHPGFGFMKFASYSRHLHSSTKTIGIVTQPFNETGQHRKTDGGRIRREKCYKVVMAFVDHLQEAFPAAKITIRNSADETIALTFARMIVAKQTVIGITSFGVFAGLASFGDAYIRLPDFAKAPNQWLLQMGHQLPSNIHLIQEPKLMASVCKQRWGTDGALILGWFQNYTLEV
jgi:hypothetical protein